jgi:hypothetical protein
MVDLVIEQAKKRAKKMVKSPPVFLHTDDLEFLFAVNQLALSDERDAAKRKIKNLGKLVGSPHLPKREAR